MTPTSKAGTSKADAFTLIEVIAALAIVSIALLGLLQLHLTSVRMAGTANATALAVLVAQEKIAEAAASGALVPRANSGTIKIDGSQFHWRTELTNANSPELHSLARVGLRQLRVDVTWREGARPQSVRMTTLLADGKIHE